MSKGLLDTLETLLAPGNRVRLSPFVEAAQFKVLFGEVPEPQRRQEHAREILKQHSAKIQAIAEHWRAFSTDGLNFRNNDYTCQEFLDAYLAYYFSTNVPKVQLVLLELVRQGKLHGDIALLDVGVGTGTTAIAVLDFVLAWGQVCHLYNERLPVTNLTLTGIDGSPGSLRAASAVVRAYSEALGERITLLSSESQRDSATRSHLARVESWARNAQWFQHDIEDAPWRDKPIDLMVISNAVNEFGDRGRGCVETMLDELPNDGLAVFIEPGDEAKSKGLMAWRKRALAARPGFISVAPCGQEYGHRLPRQCGNCWALRRESFHYTALYKKFRQAAGNDGGRAFSDFENQLLKWTYVVLQKSETRELYAPPAAIQLTDRGRVQEVGSRYMGSYKRGEILVDEPTTRAYQQYVKLCPGATSAASLVFRRDAGVEVPRLRYGEECRISSVLANFHDASGEKVLLRTESPANDPITRVHQTDAPVGFLTNLGVDAYPVLDELAYRLFGFAGLHDFQHRIVVRALTGDPTFGIAATGGGKSECFILPAMLLPGITLVVSPLTSLMGDQYEQRINRRYGLDHLATFINSNVSAKERGARLSRMEQGYYKLVYFTPEQLEKRWVLDSVQRASRKVRVRYLAMDEAHCISQWGHDFRPAYLNLYRRLRDLGANPCVLALTATASPEVRQDVCDELGLRNVPVEDEGHLHVDSCNRPELNLIVRVMPDAEKRAERIIDELRDGPRANGAVIVFMPKTGGNPDYGSRTPERPAMGRVSSGVSLFASHLEQELRQKVSIYHGKMKDEEGGRAETEAGDHSALGDMRGRSRQAEQAAFTEGDTDVMVATKGFGMGIDKSDVRSVVHWSPPGNLESYAQEAGRAGRDGQISNVVLYYTDRPGHDGGRYSETPDYEIQQWFLNERYIRSEDVEAMHAFLKNLKPRPDRPIYFTNDQAIDFFDALAGQSVEAPDSLSFQWPSFPPRAYECNEFGDHPLILDRGHLYKRKTDYIGRIIQVLYKVRPSLDAHGHAVYIKRFDQTGTMLKNIDRINASAIVQSNAYFGRWLRDAGIDETKLKRLLPLEESVSIEHLAERLDRTLAETASMISDIRAFEDSQQHKLIRFKALAAPKRGPAENIDELQAWRDYAGASRRAKSARQRARTNGRDRPNLDDWFSWKEMPSSRGWEASLGSAFFDDARFRAYWKAFNELHNKREQSDRDAFSHLLSDYIGVAETGDSQGWHGHPPNCLRGVLLGYLKTGEAVVGGNCGSCNHCVRDEQFLTDMGERRRRVVRLEERTMRVLEAVANATATLPPPERIEALAKAVAAEQARGRSVGEYISGWTGRLLNDTSGHPGAAWTRAFAMAHGLIAFRPMEFVVMTELTIGHALNDERHAGALAELITQALPSVNGNKHLARVLAARAKAHRALARHRSELSDLHEVVEYCRSLTDRSSTELLAETWSALKVLHDAEGPLPDPVAFRSCAVELGRVSATADAAITHYRAVNAGEWDWSDVQEELEASIGRANRAAIVTGLLVVVLTSGAISRCEHTARIAGFLYEQPDALRALSSSDLGRLVVEMELAVFGRYPHLASVLAEGLSELVNTANSSRGVDDAVAELGLFAFRSPAGATDDIAAMVQHWVIHSPRKVDVVANIIESRSRKGLADVLPKLAAGLRWISCKQVDRWFAVFDAPIHGAMSIDGLMQVLEVYGEAVAAQSSVDLAETVTLHLEAVVNPLLDNGEWTIPIHRAWLRILGDYAHGLSDYCLRCLDRQEKHYLEFSQDSIMRLLSIGSWDDIKTVLWQTQRTFNLCRLVGQELPGALPRLVELYERLEAVGTGILRKLRDTPEAKDLHALRDTFLGDAPGDAGRASMFADCLEVLSNRFAFNPNWKTPVCLQAEALWLARRYRELHAISDRYADLRIGQNRASVKDRLANKDASEASLDPISEYYRRLAELVVSENMRPTITYRR